MPGGGAFRERWISIGSRSGEKGNRREKADQSRTIAGERTGMPENGVISRYQQHLGVPDVESDKLFGVFADIKEVCFNRDGVLVYG